MSEASHGRFKKILREISVAIPRRISKRISVKFSVGTVGGIF